MRTEPEQRDFILFFVSSSTYGAVYEIRNCSILKEKQDLSAKKIFLIRWKEFRLNLNGNNITDRRNLEKLR